MELKSYQQDVLNDLRTYFDCLANQPDPAQAFDVYWENRIGPYNPVTRTGMKHYSKTVPDAVHLCVKVPTAGGKTFIACNALKVIFDQMPQDEPRAVVWLVPWSNLLDQTIASLSDPNHPYRQRLNALFNHRVDVYDKARLMQGASFSPSDVQEQLSIFVMSFASLRAKKKEDRKVYQENSQLAPFAALLTDRDHVLQDTDETALINVIRALCPVVVVDESHNAESDLSVDMLKALNPRFILDLTATPKENSNIVSLVSALRLKKEHMVKLPVIAYNHREKVSVIDSALHLQRRLENMAIEEQKAGGKYIRPIVLFQAQPKTADDNTTFEKLKELLVKRGIPEAQIKIKTATVNELRGVDLLSEKCPVRYIITINALKEGWDCPFAYILASLADRSSPVDVEQIVGRVLRQPYVTSHQNAMLNMSYVLTASLKFDQTLQNIIRGLQSAGFSEKDYRAQNTVTPEDLAAAGRQAVQQEIFGSSDATPDEDEIDPARITFNPNTPEDHARPPGGSALNDIVGLAHEESRKTQAQMRELAENPENPLFDDMKNQVVRYPMRADVAAQAGALLLPRFFLKIPSGGFLEGMGGDQEVAKNNLLQGFRLTKYDSHVNYQALAAEVYKIDIEASATTDSFRPAAAKIRKGEARDYIIEHILAKPRESQVKDIAHRLRQHLGDLSPISEAEVTKYLGRVLDELSATEFTEILSQEGGFGRILREKIQGFMDEYAEQQFGEFIVTERIFLKPVWKLLPAIVPGKTSSNIVKSLYEKEGDVNGFEQQVILEVASMDNVVFWHRNLGRGKGFAINGFKSNHYPDFIILTKKGNLVLLETKGGHLANADSLGKARLGNTWARESGPGYKYFMVFDKEGVEGSHTLDWFKKVMEQL